MSDLNSMVAEFERLRERKEKLEQETKDNNAALKKIQDKIIEAMVDMDMPSVTIDTEGYGAYTYTPQATTKYSLIGEERAQAAGIDRFRVLRENGFDYLIKEAVNANSFSAAIKDYIGHLGEGDEVPDDLAAVFTAYDDVKIGRTKANKKTLEKLREVKR